MRIELARPHFYEDKKYQSLLRLNLTYGVAMKQNLYHIQCVHYRSNALVLYTLVKSENTHFIIKSTNSEIKQQKEGGGGAYSLPPYPKFTALISAPGIEAA